MESPYCLYAQVIRRLRKVADYGAGLRVSEPGALQIADLDSQPTYHGLRVRQGKCVIRIVTECLRVLLKKKRQQDYVILAFLD